MTALPQEERYTYADYLKWPTGERVELIQGQVYDMAPAPSRRHQDVSRELLLQIGTYLRGKSCRVYAAPFDVRLFAKEERPEQVDTVVQPDLAVVCRPERLDEQGMRGAPDMVAEILSPSNAGYDSIVKLNLYQRAGVREYWLVDPATLRVQVFLLEEGRFVASGVYGPEDRVKVAVLEDCYVDLGPVFLD